jgi:aspartyl-tRNA(Asn)/glutamyl-tRNA(Gln) amidotransferase subunit A
MDSAALPFLTVAELSKLIQRREVSPVDVVEAYLDRIDQVDSKLNSYITVCGEEALEGALLAERAIAAGDYLGPMHGIPVSVKDQMKTKGILTTCGSKIRSLRHPPQPLVSGAQPRGYQQRFRCGHRGLPLRDLSR